MDSKIWNDTKNMIKSIITFLSNFVKKDKPEDLDALMRVIIGIINSIYFLRAGLNENITLNVTIVLVLYGIVAGHALGSEYLKNGKYNNKK